MNWFTRLVHDDTPYATLPDGHEANFERARERWKNSNPTMHLTWGEFLLGDEFIKKAVHHGVFGKGKRILEIGPGYGRLLKSLDKLEAPLASYVGLDLSKDNIDYLARNFPESHFSFLCGDAETFDCGEKVDGVFSSATFHHFYPSNQKLIKNLAQYMSPGARLMYDVPEGHRTHFENDSQTFIRHYSRKEIETILKEAGLRLVAFDEVQHQGKRAHPRLLVIAEKPFV